MATFGYAGKILRVDLSSGGEAEVSTLDYADRFLGGRGMAAKIYWDEVPPAINAFDPKNRLLFVTGPLSRASHPGRFKMADLREIPCSCPGALLLRQSRGKMGG